MNKKMYIMFFVIPTLRGVSSFLRFKDANFTGSDDEAAEAIDYTILRLEKWANEPDLPSVEPQKPELTK